jgi:hypothetical protein
MRSLEVISRHSNARFVLRPTLSRRIGWLWQLCLYCNAFDGQCIAFNCGREIAWVNGQHLCRS